MLKITAALLLTAALAPTAPAQPCTPEWVPGLTFTSPELRINCAAVFDDGTGPALYVGGSFDGDHGGALNGLRRWDGHQLVPVGDGITGTVDAMIAWDPDRNGPARAALYVVGHFSLPGSPAFHPRVMKWDGQQWTQISGVLPSVEFHTMAVHDDGSGERIYIGGRFFDTGTGAVPTLLASGGFSVYPIYGGPSRPGSYTPTITALASFNEPQGRTLYVGGDFTQVNGVAAPAIARLRNGQWVPMPGLHIDRPYYSGSSVNSLTVCQLPSQPRPGLVASGFFERAGASTPVSGVALWDGQAWAPIGPLSLYPTSSGPTAFADLGSGPSLYRLQAGLERWTGSNWVHVSDVQSFPAALSTVSIGGAQRLCITGSVWNAGTTALPGVGLFDGNLWTPIGTFGNGLNGRVNRFCKGDIGSGETLFAAGAFSHAGATYVDRVCRWEAGRWQPVGSGLLPFWDVSDVTVFDDGAGPRLYAAMFMEESVMRLEDGRWKVAGQPVFGARRFVTFDTDGPGPLPPSLFAMGRLWVDGQGCPAARWTGRDWEALPAPALPPEFSVSDGCVFDPDGPGPEPDSLFLVAFATLPADLRILRWGSGGWNIEIPDFPLVTETFSPLGMAVHDDGSGPALYVAGPFSAAPAIRLRGRQWEAVGGSGPGYDPFMSRITGLASLPLPEGRTLMMLGSLDWDPTGPRVITQETWRTYPYSANHCYAAEIFDDGSGPALFLGGDLYGGQTPGGQFTRSTNMAVLHLCPLTCTPDYDGDGDFRTDHDIEAFFACLGGRCCAACASADFNNDGDTGTDQDIEAFFRVLGGGTC